MWTEAYHYTKWHLDPCSHLAILHGPKLWGSVPPPLFEGEYVRAGCPSNTMSPGPRSTSVPSGILIDPAVWPQQTWAENWGLCPFWGEELGPHLTQYGRGRGLSPCRVRSFIMIHPTVLPQYTIVTDRTDRQQSDSIGRTVWQTVALKRDKWASRENCDFFSGTRRYNSGRNHRIFSVSDIIVLSVDSTTWSTTKDTRTSP